MQPDLDTLPQHDARPKTPICSDQHPGTHFADGALNDDKACPRLDSDQTQRTEETQAQAIVHGKDHAATNDLIPTVAAMENQLESITKLCHKDSAVTMADLTTSHHSVRRESDMIQPGVATSGGEKKRYPSAEELELELRALSASLREVRH